jgi:hypothetical protein
MALIKSALEIALEKTKDMKVDPEAIEAAQLKADGKRSAGLFLDDPASMDLAKKLAELPKDKRRHMKEGMLEVLSAQIQLPTSFDAATSKLDALAKGYTALCGDSGLLGGPIGAAMGGAMAEKKIQALFQQLTAFFNQYIGDMKNIEQAIKKQWAPKLREKERQMAARMGQDVHLDPMMDPEFSAFYKQNVGAVRQQYEAALAKAKADLANIVGVETEKRE